MGTTGSETTGGPAPDAEARPESADRNEELYLEADGGICVELAKGGAVGISTDGRYQDKPLVYLTRLGYDLDELDELISALRQVRHELDARNAVGLGRWLGYVQQRVLQVLKDGVGRTVPELQGGTNAGSSSVYSAVTRLLRLGYIEVGAVDNPTGRMTRKLCITGAGKAVLETETSWLDAHTEEGTKA